ncbi:MAG: hypothetical protein ACM37V_08350 [Gemmatimonadota bacterium]
MLSVRRGTDAVAFYKVAFGARELFKIEDGGAVVAELAVQGAKFWVADESPPHHNFSPETLGGATARFVLVVEDPRRFPHPRFRRIDTISARNHVHHFRLTTPAEVDADFRAWVREAYAVGAQAHLRPGRGA